MNVTCRFRAIVAAGLLWAIVSTATAQGGGGGNATAPVGTGAYFFSPDQSTLVQTGGIAGVHWTYRVQGQFQLILDRDVKPASFAHVDATATDASSPQRTLDLNQAFNLTLLVGTTVDDKTISFTGKASDGSDVRIRVTLQEALVRLAGQTTPPPGGRDFFSFSLDAVAQRKYSGGTGEPNDPYQIATAADLIALGETSADYNKHFILTADIDLDPYLPGRKVFDKAVVAPKSGDDTVNPPGTGFTGSFDGKGHTIRNLTVSGGAGGYLGLFGLVWSGGRIRNVGLENAWITGASGSSGLGSLVGTNYQGIIDSCYAAARVAGGEGCVVIGGLVGGNQGIITYCYALGSVTVGKNSKSAGGLVGSNANQITQCYASVAVSSSGRSTGLGGLVGLGLGSSLNDCFWNVETSGLSQSDGGVGLTTAQMQDPSTFIRAGWDFVDIPTGSNGIWARPARGRFPILWWQLPESQRPLSPSFSGGTGRPNDPYLIATAAELNRIGCDSRLMKAHFKLIDDIDLKGIELLAIGSEVFPFTGVLDGNGHTISNFTRTSTNAVYAGLFAYIDGPNAEVTNLGLIAPRIEGGTAWHVGGLVGWLGRGTIRNCYVQDGGIYGGRSTAAGLVGISWGTIIDCRANCSIFGINYAGGLVGVSSGTIINCTSSGNVSGYRDVGGLLGMNRLGGVITACSATGNVSAKWRGAGGLVGDNTSRVINCYARGSVSGDSAVGGLVGSNGQIQTEDIYFESPGDIINCYSTGAVVGASDVGGLVGLHEIGPVISSFWDIQTSGQSKSAVGVGKTTGQMRDIQTYLDAGWDLVGEIQNGTSEIWQMPPGGGYPILAVSVDYTPPQLKGSGTPGDPYLISNAIELGAVVHYNSSAHYRLAASLDLSGIRWSTAVIPHFEGTFDGNSHTISHLTIQGGSRLGLFGQVGSGTQIKNLGAVDVNIVGSGDYVGGLAGTNGGTMTGCYSTGAVTSGGSGPHYGIGGLIGSNSGAVTQCHSTATVDGTSSDAGGLVGENGGSLIECYSTGAVSAKGSDIGGLAGYNGGTVTQCYSVGAVSGTNRVGGLVGSASVARVTASFWDTQTSGQTASVGGTGRTTAQMHAAKTFLDAGWDFVGETKNGTKDIWWIDEGKGYPHLWWEARN